MGDREKELCATASTTDYTYLLGSVFAVAGTAFFDANLLKASPYAGIRLMGAGWVGLSWGFFIGGGYLALPKCSQEWVNRPPAEGDVRKNWPFAISLALLSGATAPIWLGIESGTVPRHWPLEERQARVIISSVTGFAGALLPYLLPPKTWRAAQALERVRFAASDTSVTIGYAVSF